LAADVHEAARQSRTTIELVSATRVASDPNTLTPRTLVMNIKHAAVAFAALTTLAGAPLLVSAQTTVPGNPVVVSDVRVYPAEDVGNGEMTRPGALDVTFRNTRDVAATDVFFEVSSDGMHLDKIHDTGRFAPNVTTRHEFLDQSYATDQSLTVIRVTFADGSVWISGVGVIAPGAECGQAISRMKIDVSDPLPT
jgi:hypothetical protein